MARVETRFADSLVGPLRQPSGNVPVLLAARRRDAPERPVAARHARFPGRDRRRGTAGRALCLPALREAVFRELVLLPAASQRMRALPPAAEERHRRGGVVRGGPLYF